MTQPAPLSKEQRRSLAFLDPQGPVPQGPVAKLLRTDTHPFGWRCTVKSYEHVGPKWAPNVDFHAEALAPGQAPENLRFRFADLKALHKDLKDTLGSNSSRLPKLPDQAVLEKSNRRSLFAILCFCCSRRAKDERVEHVQQFMVDLCLALRETHGRHDDFVLLCKPFGAFIRRAAIASRLQARSEAVIKGNFSETEMVSMDVVEHHEEKRGSFFDPVADMIEEALGPPGSTSPSHQSLARGPWRRGTRETRGGRVSQRPSGRGSQALASPRRSALLAPLSASDGSFDRTASPLRDPPGGATPLQLPMVSALAPLSFGVFDAELARFGLAAPSSRGSGVIDVSFGVAPVHAATGAIFSQASSQRGRRLSDNRTVALDAAPSAVSNIVSSPATPAAISAPSMEKELGDSAVSGLMSAPEGTDDGPPPSAVSPADPVPSIEEDRLKDAGRVEHPQTSPVEQDSKTLDEAEQLVPEDSATKRHTVKLRSSFKRFSASDAEKRTERPSPPPTTSNKKSVRRAKSDIFQPIALDESMAAEMVFESMPLVSKTDAKMTPLSSPRPPTDKGIPAARTDSRNVSPRPGPGPHLLRSVPPPAPSSDRPGQATEDKDAERKDPRSWSDPQGEPASDATRGRPKAGSGEGIQQP